MYKDRALPSPAHYEIVILDGEQKSCVEIALAVAGEQEFSLSSEIRAQLHEDAKIVREVQDRKDPVYGVTTNSA